MRIVGELKRAAMQAMRDKDNVRSVLYRTIIGEVENAVKTDAKYSSANDSQREEIENSMVLRKLKRFREDTTASIEAGADPTGKLHAEMQVYNALWDQYAPKSLTEAETIALVEDCFARGINTIPKVMGELNSKYKGKLDNALVRSLVEQKLKG